MNKGESVVQDWVNGLTWMQQSVLFAAVRGPDGIRKDHVAKLMLRWYRRCILKSAFDRSVLTRPDTINGGSFTGPSIPIVNGDWRDAMSDVVAQYLSCVDELPHHFQLHIMHAAEIIGYKHPDPQIRHWWFRTYCRMANDLHLVHEAEHVMDRRLGDYEEHWKQAEEVTAKGPE